MPEHATRCLAAHEEAGVTSEFPCLEEEFVRGLNQRPLHVRTGVEQTYLYRSDVPFDDFAQVPYLGLPACVDTVSPHALSGSGQFVDHCLRFSGVASGDADLVASRSEAARYRRSYCVPRPDQKSNAAHF